MVMIHPIRWGQWLGATAWNLFAGQSRAAKKNQDHSSISTAPWSWKESWQSWELNSDKLAVQGSGAFADESGRIAKLVGAPESETQFMRHINCIALDHRDPVGPIRLKYAKENREGKDTDEWYLFIIPKGDPKNYADAYRVTIITKDYFIPTSRISITGGGQIIELDRETFKVKDLEKKGADGKALWFEINRRTLQPGRKN